MYLYYHVKDGNNFRFPFFLKMIHVYWSCGDMTSIVLDKQNVTYFPTDTIYSQETQDNHFFWVKHVNQNRTFDVSYS
jgi:hypothetical protein